MTSPVQMATYPATAHTAAHTACATTPSNRRGRSEATIVPTAAAPQPNAICQAKGALARRTARRTSRIQSLSINEPPRANTDPMPRHPATPGLTALEILKREPASHGSNAELGLRGSESLPRVAASFWPGPSRVDPAALSAARMALTVRRSTRGSGRDCGSRRQQRDVWPSSSIAGLACRSRAPVLLYTRSAVYKERGQCGAQTASPGMLQGSHVVDPAIAVDSSASPAATRSASRQRSGRGRRKDRRR